MFTGRGLGAFQIPRSAIRAKQPEEVTLPKAEQFPANPGLWSGSEKIAGAHKRVIIAGGVIAAGAHEELLVSGTLRCASGDYGGWSWGDPETHPLCIGNYYNSAGMYARC